MMTVRQIIEGTILLIIIYLILSRAGAFVEAVGAIASGYRGAVSTLQGR